MTVNQAKADIKAYIKGHFQNLSDPERMTVLRDLITDLTHQEEDLMKKMDDES